MTLTPSKTQHQAYILPDGSKVPSVTTILGSVIAKPYLMKWANNLGLQGKPLAEEQAATLGTGTLLHAMIESDLTGESIDTSGFSQTTLEAASRCFTEYWNWKQGKKIKAIEIELRMIHDTEKFGGTIDALLEIDGVLTLIDWKTSNSISLDYLLQLAAYRSLLGNTDLFPERLAILRLPKNGDRYEYWEMPVDEHARRYSAAWQAALMWYREKEKAEPASKYQAKK